MTVADALATLRAAIYTASTANPVANVEAALARVEAEIARLEGERLIANPRTIERLHQQHERAEAADAEIARLRDGLRRIAESGPRPRNLRSDLAYVIALQGQARALLAEDGAADGWDTEVERAEAHDRALDDSGAA